MNRWRTFLRVVGPALGAGLLSILVWLVLFLGSGITIRSWALLSVIAGGSMITAEIIYYQARGRLPGMGVMLITVLAVMALPLANLLMGYFDKKDLAKDTSDKSISLTEKEEDGHKPPSPTAEDEASGTIVGGPKVVVSKVAPDRINEWMLRYMAGPDEGWSLMRRQWTGAMDRYGYLPIPIGPVMTGAEVVVSPDNTSGIGLSYQLGFVNQNHDQQADCLFRESWPGENVIRGDTVALFLIVRPDSLTGLSFKEALGRKLVHGTYTFSVSISRLPSHAGLWIGAYSTCMPNSLQKPGVVPFRIDGEGVDWTMRMTFIPSDPVAPGAWELKETISTPGFYDTKWHRLWLLPAAATIDTSNPQATMDSVESQCVFRKDLRPLFTEREGPTRDGFEITSEEVRRFWQNNPGKEVEWAKVCFQPAAQSLVYWEVFFPVGSVASEE